ncbi:MAG: hypothetical protein E6R03_01570 [Hyphomicrobiaceae bacterium]|nr:MAG: hypothetical protein E6R03_01570 [Hyphomicrobiaceae bacterium]
MSANHRRNQQDGEYRPKIWGGVNGDVSDEFEISTVRYWEDGQFYGIQLAEAPIRGDGIPTIRIYRRVGMVDTLLTEVELEIDPSTGEFSVDYEEAGYDGTGRVFASPSEEGNTWVVKRYAGVGETIKDEENLEIDGDLTLGGVIEDTDGEALAGHGTRGGATVPFYAEEIEFTLDNGSTVVPHGVASGYTDGLIFNPRVRDEEGTQNPGISQIDWDDTNFTITASLPGSRTAMISFFRWKE